MTAEEILAAQWADEVASAARPSPLRAVALAVCVLDDLHADNAELGKAVRQVLAVFRAGGPS